MIGSMRALGGAVVLVVAVGLGALALSSPGRVASGVQVGDLPVLDDPVGRVLDVLGTDCFVMANFFGGSSALQHADSAASRAESLDEIIARTDAQLVGQDRSGAVWAVARSGGTSVGQQLVAWTDSEGTAGWRVAASITPSRCEDG